MSHSQNDLRGQKNLGPRTFWREGGAASRFLRRVELEDQDKITPADPARGENTALRDAAKETTRQDRVKLARSLDPWSAQPLSRGNPFVDGLLLGARTAVANQTRSPTRCRSTGSSQSREAGVDLRHIHQLTIAERYIGLQEIGVERNRRGRENTIHEAQGLGCLGDAVQNITTHASFSASRMGSGTAKRI
jgi:hypothetical protein